MKTINAKTKRAYVAPSVELIQLDNEISLQLESPTGGVGEEDGYSANAPEYFNSDPYKNLV